MPRARHRWPSPAPGLLLLLLLELMGPARSNAGDRSSRFPQRREGGGTRSGCAARLLAPLVPEHGPGSLGEPPRLGLIEGPTPRAAPLVLRFGALRLVLPAQAGASLRLVTLPRTLPARLAKAGWDGLWESYPACEGEEEPVAPPALAPLQTSPNSGGNVPAISGLWPPCGGTVATAAILSRFGYGHLLAQLPERLPVVCAEPLQPSAGAAHSSHSHTSRRPVRPGMARSPQANQPVGS